MDRWTRNATERRRENHFYEALAFARHGINLVFDEENMKPDRLTKTPENAGIDPSTIRVSKRYHESTREDDDPHSPTSTRVSDIFTGVDKASNQVREPIENDEERLAMKRGDMPPPLPQRDANPRIREDQALQECFSNSDKTHPANPADEFTQAWFNYCRTVFPQSVRKTGTNVDIYNMHPSLQQYGFLQSEE